MTSRRRARDIEPPVTKNGVSDDERTLPNNLEAERSVLGAILVHNDAYDRAAEILKPRHFYRDAHRRIFDAIRYLIDERKVEADFVTLKEEIVRRGELNDVGGPAYIASLSDGVPRATNVAYYAGIVREKAILRDIIDAGNRAVSAAYEAGEPAEAILRKTDQALLDLQNGHEPGRLIDLRQSTMDMFPRLEHRVAHRGELRGLDTGFASINELTLGWMPGELIVVAARPSIGKTIFMLNTAVAAAKCGQRVGLFSLEMRRPALEDRLLAHLAGVDATRIRTGFLGSEDYGKLSAALEVMHALPVYIDDRSGQTVQEIRMACRRLRSEGGLGLVGIDYVQLIQGTLDRRGATRNEEITDISRRLKVMADELGAPVLLLSQLRRLDRKHGDPRPKLDDLRESGSLEQDADIVAFLHRKNHREGGVTQFILEKQRNGPTGTVKLSLDRDTQTFSDAPEGAEEPAAPADEASPTRRKRA